MRHIPWPGTRTINMATVISLKTLLSNHQEDTTSLHSTIALSRSKMLPKSIQSQVVQWVIRSWCHHSNHFSPNLVASTFAELSLQLTQSTLSNMHQMNYTPADVTQISPEAVKVLLIGLVVTIILW